METTPNLGLPLLESDKEVSEEHHKINIFVKALDARLGEVAVTLGGLAAKGHDHEQDSINGLVEALALLAAKDHGHKLADLLDVDVADAPTGKVLQKIGEKWGLGDLGYSAEQINNFLTQKASSDHQHGVEDVTNLATLLGEKANAQAVSQALSEKAAKSETLLLTKARVTEEGVFEVNKGTAEAPDWEEYKSGAPALMGMVFNYDGVSVPPGCEALGVDNRRVLSRAIHPTFWERIKDVALPEDDPRLVDGFFYGVGDGATTFTLPASKGQFVASLGGDRAAQGEFQADGVKQGDVKFGHTSAYIDGSGNNFPDGGVAKPIIEGGGSYNTGSKVANTHMGVFGDASDTRPVNWALPVCIVMATGVDDEALLNALAISQQVTANASKIAELEGSPSGYELIGEFPIESAVSSFTKTGLQDYRDLRIFFALKAVPSGPTQSAYIQVEVKTGAAWEVLKKPFAYNGTGVVGLYEIWNANGTTDAWCRNSDKWGSPAETPFSIDVDHIITRLGPKAITAIRFVATAGEQFGTVGSSILIFGQKK